jgi:hypothetical protein
MLGFTDTGREREIERSRYLPQDETFTSFGAKPEYLPNRVHPLQPFKSGKNHYFLRNVAAACAGLAVISLLAVKANEDRSTVLSSRSFDVASLPQEVSFDITDIDKLSSLTLTTDVNNSWAWLEVSLFGPDGAPLFEAGREVGFYQGRDADGAWTEGSRSTEILFRAKQPGRHTAEFSVTEKGIWRGRNAKEISRLSVTADEGRSSIFWLLLSALAFGLLFAWKTAKPLFHHKARWRGTDWTEEE